MAENTLALLQYLSSEDSPLPKLTAGYSKPTTVYFQSFSYFFVYSFKTAQNLYTALLGLSFLLVRLTFVPPAPALREGRGMIGDNVRGIVSVISAIVGSVIGVNLVAFLMKAALNKTLSWYSVELSCIALYGPPALAGESFDVYMHIVTLNLLQYPARTYRSSSLRACARSL